MSTLMQASAQWRSRPADQRYTSLIELRDYLRHLRDRSSARVISSRQLNVAPVDGNNDGIVLLGNNGAAVDVTHWSFGQMAQLAGAPAGYLRELPAPMAADCINYGLRFKREVEDVSVLVSAANGVPAQLRAINGPQYGRVWNATIADALVRTFGDGINGHFRVPGEFGKRVQVTKDNTTLYASDRDMFVFLADEDRRIELPGRRAGMHGEFARGFFVWNSEVGSATFGVAAFLFDYVCCNRIVWGAQEYKEIRVRHTACAPDKWVEQVAPAIEEYAKSGTRNITQAIEMAREKKIDKLDDFLRSRFTKSVATAVQAAHITEEQRPIETLWDAATGITAYAKTVQFQDERIKLEREAGKVLDLATA